MTTETRNTLPQKNLPSVISEALRPERLLPALLAGLVVGVLEVAFAVSFAALIFRGDTAVHLSRGIGMALFAATAGIAITSLLTSLPNLMAGLQSAPSAIVGVMGVSIAALVVDEQARLATIIIAVALTTLATGMFLLGLGAFRLAGLARFLPYPVAGGFLAGTGWLLVAGGISTMSGLPFSLSQFSALLQPRVLSLWLPGLIVGAIMLALSRRIRRPWFLPAGIVAIIAGFYGAAALLGLSPAELGAAGRLLGPFPAGNMWQPVSAAELSAVEWAALWPQLPNVAGAVIVTTLALLLNATGLELALKRDIDLNREMRVAGLANLAAGAGAGMVGYAQLSLTILAERLGAGGRMPGFIAAAVCGFVLWGGGVVLGMVPTLVFGALLIYLGLSFLWEWVVEARARLSRVDYLIVLLILAVIAVAGFLPGVAVGVIAMAILFIFSYSRTSVVRHELSGATFKSRVTRNPQDRALLEVAGDQVYYLQLHGFVFFGTAHGLLKRVSARIEHTPTRYVVIDFRRVIGLDSTALLSFIKLQRLARERGFGLVLSGLPPKMRRQFEQNDLTEEEGVLRFAGDIDRAAEWCEDQFCAARTMESADRSLASLLLNIRPGAATERLVGYMERQEAAAGDYLIRQGSEPDHLFFIEVGQLSAQLETPGGEPLRLETMQGGRAVGELGFYLGTRRSAAVVVDRPSVVYRLSREALARVERDDPEAAYAFHRIIIHLLGERALHLVRVVEALQA